MPLFHSQVVRSSESPEQKGGEEKKEKERKWLQSSISFYHMEFEIFKAIRERDASRVEEIIRDNPAVIDLNWKDADGETALHLACALDGPIVAILLAHPGINVNLKDGLGGTAFLVACYKGDLACVREMLKDSRVNLNEPEDDGCTALWYATRAGSSDMIKCCGLRLEGRWISGNQRMSTTRMRGQRGEAMQKW